MCSIFSLRERVSEIRLYAWKESVLFPSLNFNPISCFYNYDILLEPLLYEYNFDHSWVDVASLFFPESWYKCDISEHAHLYVNALNLTSTAWSSPFPCSFIPFFNFFLEVLKTTENMTNVKLSNLTGIETLTSGLIIRSASWQISQIPYIYLYLFPSCCHPRYLFQVLCLHNIVERRLQNIVFLLWWLNSQGIKVMLLLS